MGTIVMGRIVARARELLQDLDPANERWSDRFLLAAANEGQRNLISLRPDANPVRRVAQLAAGVRQLLPTGGEVLLTLRRNMGQDGETPGRIVSLISRQEMDAYNPYWPGDDPDPRAEVAHYLYDPKEPGVFEVWPPQPAASQGYVELVQSELPPDQDEKTPLVVADRFFEALLLFGLHRAYALDQEETVNAELSVAYRQGYLQELGMGDAAEAKGEPKGKAEAEDK